MKPRLPLDTLRTLVNAPNGIDQLRMLVYELAFQGRLVEHGIEDARALADHLQTIGGQSYSRNRPQLTVASPFHHIPKHWCWVSMGLVGHDWGQRRPTSDFTYIDVSSIDNRKGIISGDVGVLPANRAPSRARKLVRHGSIIYSTVRPYLLNIAIVDKQFDPMPIASTAFAVLHPHEGIESRYIYHYLRCPAFVRYVESVQSGIAYPAISDRKFFAGSFPLPPLEEQKRIVAKVDELMRLCDRLEAQQQEREKLLPLLSLANHSRFVAETTDSNLQTIFHQSGSVIVADLRQTIRDLAIRGRLVKQRPSDTPVETLLEQISAVRSESGRNARRSQRSSIIGQIASAQFETPETWTWVFFGDIVINRDGERIPVSKEERAKRKKVYDYYGASGIIDKIDAYLFNKPLLLIGEDGANLINRSTPIAFMARGEYWVNNHAHVLDGISEDFLRYIELFINAINLEAYVTGTAQPKMNQAQMNRIPIALPPIEEQIRIVAKVDELMRLCDQLESQISDRTATSEAFTRAAIAAITSTEFAENEKMKSPKTEVVTALKLTKEPKTTDKAPLASLLLQQGGEVSAKALWKQSDFSEIDAFYRQLKTEMDNGWIEEDTSKREVKEVEVA
jgi:type I restriction enzyme S subunit